MNQLLFCHTYIAYSQKHKHSPVLEHFEEVASLFFGANSIIKFDNGTITSHDEIYTKLVYFRSNPRLTSTHEEAR